MCMRGSINKYYMLRFNIQREVDNIVSVHIEQIKPPQGDLTLCIVHCEDIIENNIVMLTI